MSLKAHYSAFEMFVAMAQLCVEEGEKQFYPPINQKEIDELKQFVRTEAENNGSQVESIAVPALLEILQELRETAATPEQGGLIN